MEARGDGRRRNLHHLFEGAKMQTLRTTLRVLGALTLAAAAQAALANATIKNIKADRTEAVLDGGQAVIKFTVDGDSPEDTNCGLIIEYGGSDTPDNRKLNSKDGLFPKVVEHSFTRAGTYEVKAKGGKVAATFGCSGQSMVKVVISEAPKPVAGAARPGAARASAKIPATCREGWTISQTKADRKSGAYTCKPKKGVLKAPEQRAECPAGLTYFEKGATFGCSK
jgi:hypothetical protein